MSFFSSWFTRKKENSPVEIEEMDLREEIRENFKNLLKTSIIENPDLAKSLNGNTHILEFFYIRGRVDESARILSVTKFK